MVIPSKCYENNPMTILESICLGTPVIGSDLGGIPELIRPGVNGLLFEPGNVKDLQDKISYIINNPHIFNYSVIASEARIRYSSGVHYEQLLGIYNGLLKMKLSKDPMGKKAGAPMPTDASIITTYRCQMRCKMCNIWKYPSNQRMEITPADLEKLPFLKFINVTGGEPFQRRDLEDIISVCSQRLREWLFQLQAGTILR